MKPDALLVRALLLACVTCAPARAPLPTSLVVRGADGAPLALETEIHAHPATVITFFSAHCPCQRAHDARLRELMAKDTALGVAFLVVDSEQSATASGDADEARTRGYPIAIDPGGKLARALDAEYATFSVVIDRSGQVRYRGGFDSDRAHLRADSTPFLADAVDDVLAGRAPRRAEAKTLGCTLELY